MTEMLKKELSRKTFVMGGGALIVGFSTAGSALGANGNTPFAQRGPQDFLPDLTAVDSWITLNADNTVTVTHGETELGHGTPTGILQIVAEEMDMNMSQMHYAHPESWLNATGGGSGSGGISSRSTQIRAAAALARTTLVGMAATQFGVPASSLTTADGVVSGGGKSVKYGDLLGGKMFNVKLTTQTTATPGQGIAKPVANYKVVGTAPQRIDIPNKVTGAYTYVHNVRVPGMVHARLVRPRGAGANASLNIRPKSVDETSIKHIPESQVVRIGDALFVVAAKEYDAIQAAAQLKVVWQSDPKLPGSGNFWSWLRSVGDTNTQNPARYVTDTGGTDNALKGAAKTVSATYAYPYNAHVPIGPQCSVADVRTDLNRATIYMSGQQILGAAEFIAGIPGFGIEAKNIRVIFYEGGSSYGTAQLTEAWYTSALLSKTVGKPVRIQWMRWDQHGFDEFGPAALWDVKAGIDANGKMVASDWVTYGQASSAVKTVQELTGTATWPAVLPNGGPTPSDSAVYTIPQRRVLAKTQPLLAGAFKCSPLRAPNAPQSYFASEQIVDELAHAANMDPIAFRRQNIDGTTVTGARWLAVLDASTMAAGWKAKVAASNLGSGNLVTGRGFGFGTFAGTQVGLVADIEVNKKTGKIVVKHLFMAQNNGITINPQLVGNQMSGAAIQGLSRALYEQVTFNKERITSLDWVTYPLLRFKDSPTVTLVNAHPGKYTTIDPGSTTTDVREGNTRAFAQGWNLSGSGEPPTAAVGSAVANAFFDATGARIRQAPMNAANARSALKAAGIA